MKSLLKNLSLLSMGLLIYSCNEKISAELQNGASTTVPTIVAPKEYYFKVTNASPTVLNYVLHRTGPGNASKGCAVTSSNLAFTDDLFKGEAASAHDLKSYDVSCYMDAEELSLFYNGLEFNIEASKNTCEYIAYTPYSFYDAIPGSTSSSYAGYSCEGSGLSAAMINAAAVPGSALVKAQLLAAGATLDNVNVIGCDTMVDTNMPIGSRVAIPVETEQSLLCKFDYTDTGGGSGGNGQNCDLGGASFYKLNVEYVADDGSTPANEEMVTGNPEAISPFRCGGSVAACVGGAIKSESKCDGRSKCTIISNTTENQDYLDKKTLPSLLGVRGSNIDIANFRRGLASHDLDFGTYESADVVNWGDATYNTRFDPDLMDKWALNLTAKTPSSPIIDVTAHPSYLAYRSNASVGARRIPYAADPFLGINGSSVNPFYTFYCLDRAMETKARIRMVVRDWDRVFVAGSSYLEKISDADLTTSARQDLPNDADEVNGDPGSFNVYNDVNDWDNYVWMRRAPGAFVLNSAAWEPWTASEPGSALGWFNSSIFPNQGPRSE